VTNDRPEPDFPSQFDRPFNASAPPDLVWGPPPARAKFQHNYRTHLVLFLLTLVTTTYAQSWPLLFIEPGRLFGWDVIAAGLSYSLPVLAILTAHEFGHYFACRYYNVDATLPYFIPAPVVLTGTFGAVIRIREAFPSKRALFDIGVAGPLAGFLVLLPFLVIGVALSEVGPVPDQAIYFGEPLLYKALEWGFFGTIPDGHDVMLHPMGFAAWWGMFATALNLLPFGQLDGGHIMYASLGRRAAVVSALSLGAVLALAILSPSWIAMAVLMTVMSLLFGFRHPRIIDEHDPLDARRQTVAIVSAIVFAICFTPVPIAFIGVD
jgi:membrane-associated protease RseP (regulator of RpoE activity)